MYNQQLNYIKLILQIIITKEVIKITTIDTLIQNKTVMQSNTSGPFKIIQNLGCVNGRNRCLIEFINTGSVCDVLTYNATNHRVKDPALKSISNDFDISRFDDYATYLNGLLKTIYSHMIDRCYNINSPKYNSYGALGISVCESWKIDINNFLIDARFIDGFNKFYQRPYLYELDKDYKQINIPKHQRLYSKNTCTFLYYQDNSNLRCIENKKDGYFGVEKTASGNYHARIKINNNRIDIGTFSNPIAAANAYNAFQLKFKNYELVPLLNNVPYMPPQEFVKYNMHVKEVVKVV